VGLIYLDSCLLIYLVERHPSWHGRIVAAISAAPDAIFAISPLVKLECLVGPMRRGDLATEHAFQTLFARLVLLDMPEGVWVDAARLRAQFGLRTPDALHLASAQRHGCAGLWTTDRRLLAAGGEFVRDMGAS
jgi:uncharacterized protein